MSTRKAVIGDAIGIARMLETALRQGWEGDFSINRRKLIDRVMKTISSQDGFAEVLVDDDGDVIGVFCGELTPHEFCDGYIVQELGSYVMPEHRGKKLFVEMFLAFLKWADSRPDRLCTTFSIGQINETTPSLRKLLKEHGFTQVTEGYMKT